jgi:hypothetical protein
MKKILGVIALIVLIATPKTAKSQIVDFQISEHCDNDFEFYVTVTLEGMNSISNDYNQIWFSCATLTLWNDTDVPATDVIYESTTLDTVIFEFPAEYINAPSAPNTTVHTLNVDISGTPFQEDANAVLKASTPISIIGNLPSSMCPSDDPFDMNTIVSPAGGDFYFYDGDGYPIEGSAVVGNYFDASGVIPSNNFGYVGYTYEAANGCVTKEESSIVVPLIEMSPTLSIDNVTEATCGQADGEATVIPSVMQSIIVDTYWSNGTSGATISGVESGVYTATTVAATGCKATIDVPIGSDAITSTLNITQPSCWYDLGAVDLDVTASTNYTVWWSFGVYGEDHTGLAPGVYYATITDDNGCEEVIEANLEVLSEEIKISEYSVFDEECNGTLSDNGEVNLINVTGGDGNYSYSWSNGFNTQSINGLSQGDYTVTITDGNGCSLTEDFYVGHYAFNSFYWIGLWDVTPSTCDNDGSILMDFYDMSNEIVSYSWSNGSTEIDLENIGAGTYTFEYTDIYGCSNEITATVPAIKPAVNPICLITVDSTTTTNLVVWEREQTTGIAGYNIYREEGNGVFNLRGYTPATEETVFNDVTASPKVKSWTYKIASVDNCGVEGNKSIAHTTSHLKRSQNGNDFTLTWNPYKGFDYSNNGIDIYRFTSAAGWEYVTTVNATDTLFSETVPNNTGIDYTLDYIPDNGGCTATKAQNHNSSRSNRTSGIFNPGEGTGDTNNEIDEWISDENISIYPNPSFGVFNLQIDNNIENETSYQIVSVEGKIVMENTIVSQMTTINLKDQDAGIYIVRIQSGNQQIFKRLIKQ